MAPWPETVLNFPPLDCLNVFLVIYMNNSSLLRSLHITYDAFTIVTFLVHGNPRYSYVQVAHLFFSKIINDFTISNVSHIFNSSLRYLWMCCCWGSMCGEFDRFFVCFVLLQSHLFGRSLFTYFSILHYNNNWWLLRGYITLRLTTS